MNLSYQNAKVPNFRGSTATAMLCILSIWLSGCATPSLQRTTPPQNWQEKRQHLQKMDQWVSRGVLSVSTQSDRVSSQFVWQQCRDQYRIHLFSPLSTDYVLIQGNNHHATLQTADKKRSGPDIAELTQEQLGWDLPLTGLTAWIRGINDKTRIERAVWNSEGNLALLRQAGWDIHFLEYTKVENLYQLPNKLILDNSPLQVKIVVRQWILSCE